MPDIRNCSVFFNVPACLFMMICSAITCIAFSDPAAAEDAVTLAPIVVTAGSVNNDYQTGEVNTSNTPVFYHKINADARIDFINKFFSKNQGLPSWNNSEETQTDFSTDQNIFTLKWIKDNISSHHVNTCSQIGYLFKIEEYDDSKGQGMYC